MRTIRAVVLLSGVATALWGGWKLAAFGVADLVPVALWLAGGVFAHDALVVPLTLLLALAAKLLPRPWRAPTAVGLIVLGSVTLLAIPVLGRLGARADNATLLDRNYLLGWAGLAALTVVAVVVTGWRRRAVGAGGSAVGSAPFSGDRRQQDAESTAPRLAGRIGLP